MLVVGSSIEPVFFRVGAQGRQKTPISISILGKYGGLTDMAWSPDGSTLAVGTYTGIVLYDNKLNEINFIKPIGDTPIVGELMWSPDGTHLFSGNGVDSKNSPITEEAYIWDLTNNNKAHLISLEKGLQARPQAWSLSENTVLIALDNQSIVETLLLFNTITGTSQEIDISTLDLPAEVVWSWSEENLSLQSIYLNFKFEIFLDNPNTINQTTLALSDDSTVSTSPDNRHQAILDEEIEIINENGMHFTLRGYNANQFKRFTEINWSGNGNRIAVWGDQILPNLMVADVLSGDDLLEFTYDQRGTITSAELNYDGSRLAISTFRDELLVYDFVGDQWYQRWFNGFSTDLSFNPDGSQIAAVNGASQNIYFWDTFSGNEIETWQTPNDADNPPKNIMSIAWSPDGKYIATGSWRNNQSKTPNEGNSIDLFIWSTESKEVIQMVPLVVNRADFIAQLEWSADSRVVVYSTVSNQYFPSYVGAYNVQTRELLTQSMLNAFVFDIAMHPNNEILALAISDLDSFTQSISFLNIRTGEILNTSITLPQKSIIHSISWHPSGNYLAMVVESDELFETQIWEWQSNIDPQISIKFDLHGLPSRTPLEWNNEGTYLSSWYFGENNNILGVQIWQIELDDKQAVLSNLIETDYPDYFEKLSGFDALEWSTNGRYIATNLSQHTSSVWDIFPE